jgi:hypothetical protein
MHPMAHILVVSHYNYSLILELVFDAESQAIALFNKAATLLLATARFQSVAIRVSKVEFGRI